MCTDEFSNVSEYVEGLLLNVEWKRKRRYQMEEACRADLSGDPLSKYTAGDCDYRMLWNRRSGDPAR